jgi:dihydrolipoamide dehydrogenase
MLRFLADKEYHYSFNDCIIATGSKVSKPGIPGIDLPVVMDSTAALSLEKLPQSITIVGGGVIGLEFAFMYANLGVKVTIVEFLDHLISCVDCDIADSILKIAEDRGIKNRT